MKRYVYALDEYLLQENAVDLAIARRELEIREAQLKKLGIRATYAQVDYWRNAQRIVAVLVAKHLELMEQDHD